MNDTTRPVINVADVALRDNGHGDLFAAKIGRMAPLIGSTGIGCTYTVVAPGKRAFPYHVHHVVHELFVILEGTGEYRFGDKTYPIKPGDVCAAPTGGPERAHQIVNTSASDLRYLSISTMSDTELVEYPDSNKFAVSGKTSDGGRFRFIRRMDGNLDYWDGE